MLRTCGMLLCLIPAAPACAQPPGADGTALYSGGALGSGRLAGRERAGASLRIQRTMTQKTPAVTSTISTISATNEDITPAPAGFGRSPNRPRWCYTPSAATDAAALQRAAEG